MILATVVANQNPFPELNRVTYAYMKASQVALVIQNPPADAGDIRDAGLVPGSGRSPGGGNGNHSSILTWRVPWTEEPGEL